MPSQQNTDHDLDLSNLKVAGSTVTINDPVLAQKVKDALAQAGGQAGGAVIQKTPTISITW